MTAPKVGANMAGSKVMALLLLIVSSVIAASIGSCAFVSHTRNAAFESVQLGTSESDVLTLFGSKPSVREKPGVLFARYASEPCSASCVERIWFENRLSLDTEAWSIELDQDKRAIKKSHWMSP